MYQRAGNTKIAILLLLNFLHRLNAITLVTDQVAMQGLLIQCPHAAEVFTDTGIFTFTNWGDWGDIFHFKNWLINDSEIFRHRAGGLYRQAIWVGWIGGILVVLT